MRGCLGAGRDGAHLRSRRRFSKIMAVPCGDQRDFEFARKFDLPIPAIQEPPASWFEDHGIAAALDTSS